MTHTFFIALLTSNIVVGCSPLNADAFSTAKPGDSGSSNSGSHTPTPPPPVATPTPTPTPRPTPTPTPTPPATGGATREPAAIADSLTPAGFDVFQEVSYSVGALVDSTYSSYRELLPQRSSSSTHNTDSCDPTLDRNSRFADRIAYAVELKMQPARSQLGYVASAYNMPASLSSHLPVSLISHPLCTVSSSSLNSTLGGKNIPSAAVINKANNFVSKMNGYRREALAGNREGYKKASKLWSKFMMCLSYAESLTTADNSKSSSVAQKYGPSGYRKPAGVKFYEDPLQPLASRLNIGLFQFTPTASGNVQACIREWNQLYPKCQVSTAASQAEMIRVLGSSLQTFNAFCGAAKVAGMFSVQVNSSSSRNTHPSNVNSNGSLKASVNRCVSPHFLAGRSYNHFGPFQNSTGKNLEGVLDCTFRGEY